MLDKELIWRIKTTLKQQGILQRELAARLGKKESEVSRWLSGHVGISEQNLTRIEEVLGKPLSCKSIQQSCPRQIRIGIVGTGSIARRFASEMLYVKGAFINAAYNPDGKQLNLFCDRFGINFQADSYETLLRNCDAVYVASPIATHFDYVKAALEDNRHVLCEMPFTLSRHEAAELIKFADKRGLTLLPAMKTAYCPSFIKIVEIATSGEIGEIADVSGTVTTMLSENETTDFNNERLLENATYPIMAAFKLFGNSFRSVNAFTRYEKESGKALFSHAVISYGDKVATLKVGTGVKSEGSLLVSGTKGYIYVPAPWWKTDYFELRFENATDNRKFYFPYENAGLRYEIQAFVDRISGKQYSGGLSRGDILKMVEIQNKIITRDTI